MLQWGQNKGWQELEITGGKIQKTLFFYVCNSLVFLCKCICKYMQMQWLLHGSSWCYFFSN